MIRHQLKIDFAEVDPQVQRAAVSAHHRALAYPGDAFLPSKQLSGTASEIMINGTAAGLVVIDDDQFLVLCTLTREAGRYDRQVMELVLRSFDVTGAFAASWDAHHVGLFGGFAREIASQAYQFQLLDPDHLPPAPGPGDPLAGLTITTAAADDLPYLNGAGFIDDYSELLPAGRVRIARWNDAPAGIGLLAPHPLHDSVVDLGMFTEAAVRRKGVGGAIIAAAARETLENGLTPVAGCWWRNWQSRPTLEAAGLTCIGTIFRLTLDRDLFAD